MGQEQSVPKGISVLRPEEFNYLYRRFTNQEVPIHRVEDNTGTVLPAGVDILAIDYSQEPGTKYGGPSRRDQRILILRTHSLGDSEAADEDARHEMHIGADGTLLQLGGLEPLSQEEAAKLADSSLFGVLSMLQNLDL